MVSNRDIYLNTFKIKITQTKFTSDYSYACYKCNELVSEWQRAQYCVTFTPYVYIVLCTCKIYLHWQSVYPQYKKHNQHYKLIWSRSKTNKSNAHKIWNWTGRQSKCPMSTSCIVINLWREWTDIYYFSFEWTLKMSLQYFTVNMCQICTTTEYVTV